MVNFEKNVVLYVIMFIVNRGGEFMNKVLKYFNQKKYIKMVENSSYFDKAYYLAKNLDIKNSGVNPAKHYYMYGWREGRNPSADFDNDRYFKYNKLEKNINPIVHYTLNKDSLNLTVPAVNSALSVEDILDDYFFENKPLKVLSVSNLKKHRLNIIFNGFDSGCFFGGKATALILAIQFASKYHYNLRVISQNPDAAVFYEFLDLFHLKFEEEVSFFSINSGQLIEIDEKDDFICTMWSNADIILNTQYIKGKIFYVMQEVETFFYDHGDNHLRCFSCLTDDRIIPIVNSKLLYDYLCSHGYNNVVNNGIYFEPVFSGNLLKPSKDSFHKKDKYSLFFYARPSHQRNLFYFCLDVLNEAFNYGVLDKDEWVVYTAGDGNMPNFHFDVDVDIERLGVMSWNEYCDFMSTIDLCFSVIYTPHPSYPPLDAVTAGAVAVTNKFENKQDLSNYSKNIVMGDLNKKDMLRALECGSKLAKNVKVREANYKTSNTAGEWQMAFKDVLKFMNDKIGD